MQSDPIRNSYSCKIMRIWYIKKHLFAFAWVAAFPEKSAFRMQIIIEKKRCSLKIIAQFIREFVILIGRAVLHDLKTILNKIVNWFICSFIGIEYTTPLYFANTRASVERDVIFYPKQVDILATLKKSKYLGRSHH